MRKKKFQRSRKVKYGNINKGFTEAELKRFLSCCTNMKAKFAFKLMANLGLRACEAVKVNIDEIDLQNRRIRIQTAKAKTGDSLYLHDEIFPLIKKWIDSYYDEILAKEGYLLFSEVKCNKKPHISANWLRKEFRNTAILAGLNEWYAKSEETVDYKPTRKLNRLTTHSLRHYFITKVYKTTKDPVVTQKLARHTDMQSTQVYIHTAKNDLDNSISKTFEKSHIEKKGEKEDFKKLMQVWELMR